MKRIQILTLAFLIPAVSLIAGNKERIGQAGANELLINPWASSAGMAGANTAFVSGVESFNLNMAGLSFLGKTQVYFSNVNLFSGADISMNSLALGQRVSEEAAFGLSVTSMTFGELDITTTDQPDGGQGTFSPQFFNIAIGYARSFSNSIHGGAAVRIISESISNVGAQGIALDAGIRYVTGLNDRIKFGIALRNVGPKLRFSGDGLATTVLLQGAEFTVNQRAEGFEMPALLNIGASYDIYFKTDSSGELSKDYRLTIGGNFTSNSFSQDQIQGGVEFGFMQYFAARVGLVYEENAFSTLEEGRVTARTGPTAGFTVKMPFNKEEASGISLDYSYRFANPLGGTHGIGLRIDI